MPKLKSTKVLLHSLERGILRDNSNNGEDADAGESAAIKTSVKQKKRFDISDHCKIAAPANHCLVWQNENCTKRKTEYIKNINGSFWKR